MNFEDFDNIYSKKIEIINEMNLKEEQKKEILNILEELNYQHKRLEKYCKLNMEAYEGELEIFLENYRKKDDDANYLYRELNNTKYLLNETTEAYEKIRNKYKNNIFYKLYIKFYLLTHKTKGGKN